MSDVVAFPVFRQIKIIKFSLLNLMKKSKFSEHQIIHILKEYESGKATKDICREHGISTTISLRYYD